MIYNKRYVVNPKPEIFQFNEKPINETDSYKYLGTIFSNSTNIYLSNFKHLRSKALKAIASLRQKLRKSIGYSTAFQLIMKLFDCYIMPILDYGAEVWFQD